MKKALLSLLLLALMIPAFAQWTNKTMSFGGLNRTYRLYVSPNYNASNPAAIVVTLHGLGDNMTNFSQLGFAEIGDTANIIVICPQAVSDALAGTAWNSGAGMYGYYPNSAVNDIGFINALVDTTKANYSVDPLKIYCTGFSMGGFMTYRMALQSNARFAAFASMSGTVGASITTFNPNRTIPIAHFHGTADGTVAFVGNTYGLDPDSLVHKWRINNGITADADTFSYPDVVPGDGITVDRLEYRNGDANADVNFYVMYGCDHTVLFPPSNDIDEPLEIWKFFKAHTHTSYGITSTPEAPRMEFFPNPAQGYFTLITAGSGTACIYDLAGKLLVSTEVTQEAQIIDISALNAGMYLLAYEKDGQRVTEKLMVE